MTCLSIDEILVNRKRIVLESRLLLFLPLLAQISKRIGAWWYQLSAFACCGGCSGSAGGAL
jgi:hypothetical protein